MKSLTLISLSVKYDVAKYRIGLVCCEVEKSIMSRYYMNIHKRF